MDSSLYHTVLALPLTFIIPENQILPIPVFQNARVRRAPIFIPLLTTLGITAGVATGKAGITYSATQIARLTTTINDDLDRVVAALINLQDQPDSLAEVMLQNQRGLDLLTAERGGLCVFFKEESNFYTNKSGVVHNMAQQLRD